MKNIGWPQGLKGVKRAMASSVVLLFLPSPVPLGTQLHVFFFGLTAKTWHVNSCATLDNNHLSVFFLPPAHQRFVWPVFVAEKNNIVGSLARIVYSAN